MFILITSRSFLLIMRNVSDKICTENQNTHFAFSIFFLLENCTIYEIMWKNIVKWGRPQLAIWRTHARALCNTHYSSTATMVARRRLDVGYTYTLSLYLCFIMRRLQGIIYTYAVRYRLISERRICGKVNLVKIPNITVRDSYVLSTFCY
jgi:hypothetical protein